MKNSLISLAIVSALSGASVHAAQQELIIRIPLKSNLSEWSGTEPIYHPWVNVGEHYNCAAWSPLSSSINFGQSFTQTRDCDQDQKRDVEIRELDSFSNIVKTVRVEQEDRTITETESQGAVGEYRNWVSHESTFTEWADFGVDYEHSTWSPVAAVQTADFTQSRNYKHDQERFEQKREFDTVTEDIRDIGELVRHTQITNRNESRPVDVNVTLWSDVGTHYNCAAWAPTPEEVDVYQAFTQTRDCSQNQTRHWTYIASGSEIHARDEAQTITEVESQPSVGARRNWVSHDSTFTAWADQGATHSYTAWAPAPVSQTSAFTQTRAYKQPQERFEQKREIDAVSGDIKDVGEPIRHAQDDSRSESRSVAVNWTAWSDTTRDSYSAWGPTSYTETANFNQSRTYSQNQVRDRVYTTGGTELYRATESGAVSGQSESRSVVVAATSWSDTNRGSYSSWTPTATTQTSNFIQSRTYTQNQERIWSYKIGGTDLSSRIETRAVANQSESQTVTVSWSAWTNTGTHYTCGSWTPATNTVAYGEFFTQTRSCKQDQTRSRIYKVGSTTINTVSEAQTIDETESQSAVGAGSWTSTTSTFTAWVNSGAGYGYGTWAPAAGTQTANYTQTRSYSQDQTRTEQKREIDTIGGTIRNIGSPIAHTQTITPSESQSVVVTSSAWANTTTSGHTAWSPAASAQTASFTQSRTYTQAQSRTWTHKVGTTTIHTRNEAQSLTGQSESRTVTVSWSGWANSDAAYGHTTWSPAPAVQTADFTQTRGFSQDQTRTRTYSSGESFTETQTVTSGTESRTVNVSWTAWANSGGLVSCGVYSPAATTQTASFTQTRSCSQAQTRTRNYAVSGTNVGSASESQTLTGISDSRTVTVSWSAWTNTGAHYTCGTWTPATNTVAYNQSFTQTRSCKQDQTRNRIYTGSSTTINTVAETQSIDETESQSAVGAGSWSSTTSTFTAWVNSGAGYNHGTWAPAAGAQTTNYTQTRSYSQDQTRTEQKREFDTIGGTIRNVGTPIAHTQTITPSENQSVAVTASSWANTTTSAHTAWSPAASAQTASFTQSRTYTQAQSRTWTHKVGTSTIHTRNETQSLTGQSESRTVTVSWSGWANSGAAYGHTTWSPAPATQTADFTQTRGFSQDQTRTRTYSSGESFTESQTVTSGTESRTVNVSWTAWANSGGLVSCGAYSPAATTQTASFTQTRSCSQAQTRTRNYTVSGTNIGSVSESQTLTGISDSRTVTVGWSAWTNTGAHHTCGTWTPATDTVGYGVSYTQTRTCKQDQTRNRIYTGSSTTINTVTETQSINETESQSAVGVGSWASTTSTFTSWVNSGAGYGYGTWAPAAGTQTSNYTQTRSYSQDQTRTEQKREVDTIGGTIRNVGTPIAHTQTINPSENQSVSVTASAWANTTTSAHTAWSPAASAQTASFTQSRTYTQAQSRTWTHKVGTTTIHTRGETQNLTGQSESRTVTVSWSGWANSGAAYGHTTWSPAPAAQTADFTQTRGFSQDQTRTRTYSSGESFTESQTLTSGTESRTVNVSWTAWVNSGGLISCGSYSPAATTQTASFTQTRSCSQAQTRTRNYTVSGTNIGSASESQTLTGISDSRTVTVGWSAWTNTGAHHTCGTWTPATNTVAYNQSFTQTRSCKQDQTRNRIYTGSSTTINTVAETQSINETESQSAVGVGSWTSTTSTFTAWVNSGSGYSYGTWAPAAGTQTSNYTQTRSYSQDQTRTEQKREVDTIGGTIRNVGSPITQTQTITPSDNQSVSVTASAWANTTTSGHTTWSPAASAQTANFTQSRTYTQAQSRTWTHKVGTTTIHTRGETQNLTGQSESRTVTVSWSGWVNIGVDYGFSSWTPSATTQTSDFTQSQTYKRDQNRTRSYSSGESYVETQTVTGTDYRTVNVSWTAWANSGGLVSCGSYSPAASTQTSSFTQTRSCSQAQTRTRNYTVSGTNVGSASESQTLTGVSNSRTVTVSWTGWVNVGVDYGFSSWTPSATTQTSGFTQSQTYKRDQNRTRSYSSGESYVETQTATGTDYRSVTVSWSSWVNSGSVYSCGAWSPATSTVAWGQSFTQTRSCTQGQVRNRSYSSGESYQESQGVGVTQSQGATGTSDYIASYTYSVWSGWSNSGGVYGCSAWSPDTSAVCYGAGFTQTRSCSQNQTRSRSVTAIWASGATSSAGTESDSQTISSGQSQSATGAQSCWVPASSTFTSWSTYSTGYGTWTPGATSQSSNFTQTRTVTLYQEQYEQKREYNASANQYRDVGTAIRTTRAVAGSDESRTVTVSNSGWVNSGSPYNCGSYSPDPSTVASGTSFTQTGSCSQNQVATYTYSIGGSYQYASQTIAVPTYRSAVGTKPVNGTWVYTSGTHALAGVRYWNATADISGQSCSPIGSTRTTTYIYRNGAQSSTTGTVYWSCQ